MPSVVVTALGRIMFSISVRNAISSTCYDHIWHVQLTHLSRCPVCNVSEGFRPSFKANK